jgi:hypothetical protein
MIEPLDSKQPGHFRFESKFHMESHFCGERARGPEIYPSNLLKGRLGCVR